MRAAIRSWLRIETTYPNGSTFNRLESLGFMALEFVVLLVISLGGAGALWWAMAAVAHQSTGEMIGHVVKLGILGLL